VHTAKELLRATLRALLFAFVGGVIGFITAVACEEIGLVRYSFYVESWNAGFRSMFFGAGTGGLLGFAYSIREWYRRLHQATEVEDELW
jgi:hypothetical protein